jgi:tetratricopeptide (TPR) repeat protein
MEKLEDAVRAYDKAIQLNSNMAGFYFNRAIVEYNLGFKEDACADFQNAAELGDTEAAGYIKEFCH